MKLLELLENYDEHDRKIAIMRRVVQRLGELANFLQRGTRWVNSQPTESDEPSLIDAANSLSALVRLHHNTSDAKIKEIVSKLNADAEFSKIWIAKETRYRDGYPEFAIEDLGDFASRNKPEKRKAQNFKLSSIPNDMPTTAFSKAELEVAAKKTGEVLFSKHRSGLIWGGNTRIKKTNTLKLFKELVANQGEDAELQIGTFQFVFFPSGNKKPLDGSDTLNLVKDTRKLQDKDGNIYLCDNTNDTLILIVKPVIEPKQYDNVHAAIIGKT